MLSPGYLFVVAERRAQRLHLLCEVDVVHRHEHVARQETFASHLNQHLDLIHGYAILFVLCLDQLETSSFASCWQTCRQVSSWTRQWLEQDKSTSFWSRENYRSHQCLMRMSPDFTNLEIYKCQSIMFTVIIYFRIPWDALRKDDFH